jgi:sugar-phosphatase
MLRAAIFDMDGLLVDSEPLWTEAEVAGFGAVGILLDAAACGQTVGLGLEEVVALRFRQHPWSAPSRAAVAEDIHRRVVALIRQKARAMPGAPEALAFVRAQGAKVGLATTSDREIITAVLEVLPFGAAFDFVQSAAELPFRKPHPAVYLACAEGLDVSPLECLALEDSVVGVISAKAARMRTIAVPERRQAGDPRFCLADLVLPSLRALDASAWQQLAREP